MSDVFKDWDFLSRGHKKSLECRSLYFWKSAQADPMLVNFKNGQNYVAPL
jgi:hypothetical protein